MATGQDALGPVEATVGVAGDRLRAAAADLRAAAQRWAAMRPGDTWVLDRRTPGGSTPGRRRSAAARR